MKHNSDACIFLKMLPKSTKCNHSVSKREELTNNFTKPSDYCKTALSMSPNSKLLSPLHLGNKIPFLSQNYGHRTGKRLEDNTFLYRRFKNP